MATATNRVLTWKVPTPRGLWHRAFVVTPDGLFLTQEMDSSAMNELKTSAETDPAELRALLTGHGRSKRASFFSWSSISSVRHNSSAGTIEVETDSVVTTVKVADRERLEKLARVLVATTATRKQNAG